MAISPRFAPLSTNRRTRKSMNRLTTLAVMLIAGFLMSARAYALSCGDTVTANTTLTADLNCVASSGLIIGANNVTIDLNGHTISCNDIHGYMGSYQNSSTT